ncbi:collagen alpha-2(I) chain-like [Zonotrichia leucophrys gambelii]|uniref:collagen alpha-2(I) chain-like n=1 Tax=Zonotrichia leucophrys gambelii TaxID=257770 RepID=UPI0031405B8B
MGIFRWGEGAVGGLLHWKRTEIGVFIASVIPNPVIHFQRLPRQLTRAQTLITPFVFLSPIKEPSAGDWEAPNTCGPHTFPVLPREQPGLPERRTRLTGGWIRSSPIPTVGSERHAGSCPSGPASGPAQQGPPAAARPAHTAEPRPGSAVLPAPTRLPPAALGRGRPWGDTAPAPAGTAQHGTAQHSTAPHGAPAPPGAGEDRAPGARRSLRAPPPTAPARARPPPTGAIDAPRSGRWLPLPRGTVASPAAGGSPPHRGSPRPLWLAAAATHGRRDATRHPPGPAPAPPPGAARGKVTDPRSPPGSIKRRGPARRRHGNKRVSLPPASGGGGGGRAAARGSASAGAVPTGAPPPPPPLKAPHVETPLPGPREGPRHVARTPQAAREATGTGGRGAGRGGGGGRGQVSDRGGRAEAGGGRIAALRPAPPCPVAPGSCSGCSAAQGLGGALGAARCVRGKGGGRAPGSGGGGDGGSAREEGESLIPAGKATGAGREVRAPLPSPGSPRAGAPSLPPSLPNSVAASPPRPLSRPPRAAAGRGRRGGAGRPWAGRGARGPCALGERTSGRRQVYGRLVLAPDRRLCRPHGAEVSAAAARGGSPPGWPTGAGNSAAAGAASLRSRRGAASRGRARSGGRRAGCRAPGLSPVLPAGNRSVHLAATVQPGHGVTLRAADAGLSRRGSAPPRRRGPRGWTRPARHGPASSWRAGALTPWIKVVLSPCRPPG